MSLDEAVQLAVRRALAAERPAIIAAVRAELAEVARDPAEWSPSQVRAHARCSAAAVFGALRDGTLPATIDDDPARARPGIPSRRWLIRPSDARAWAAARRAKGAT
jgi:hypothetical protein